MVEQHQSSARAAPEHPQSILRATQSLAPLARGKLGGTGGGARASDERQLHSKVHSNLHSKVHSSSRNCTQNCTQKCTQAAGDPSAIPTLWAMPRNTGNFPAIPPIRQIPSVVHNFAAVRLQEFLKVLRGRASSQDGEP